MRVLTFRRAAIAVVGALVGAMIVRAVMILVVVNASRVEAAANPGTWAGLGLALVGSGIAVVAGYVIAVLVVFAGVRGRQQSRRFTGTFAGLLAVILIVSFFAFGWGVVISPIRFEGTLSALSGLVIAPLLVTVPSAVSGILRWRWVAIVAAAGAVLALLFAVLSASASASAQSKIDAAYEGPVYVPSTSPASPLPGFHLRGKVLLNEFNTDRLELAYIKPASGDEIPEGYSIEFETGTENNLCLEESESCIPIGEALGAEVFQATSSARFYVQVPNGTVAIRGYSESDAVLEILRDLTPATIGEFSALAVDPD